MGGAVRWLKGLFGTKKRLTSGYGSYRGGYCNLPTDTVCLRPFLTDKEKEQNKNMNAVATAAEAVSVAKVSAEMVRLTGEGRAGDIITREELWAAARKALRALKGIVKLQALVRGYLVRKRAAAMLHSIQAMIRVQTAMRSKRNRYHKKEYNNIDLELNLPKKKWKFGTPKNTPRLSSSSKFATTPRLTSSSHHHTANNNRYYVMRSPSKSVSGNAHSGYGLTTPGPGYMENTQSFNAKQRSHSAPHRLSERNRLSLDEIIVSKNRGSGESLLQQQQQRYSCSSYMIL
ncbi:unnamed protein product [Eruca vesicaria subsp. sativa]|uniref:DUF4005 domain-containing protein n=1 Tax=Eruca vesicaria subsp. sativa TaxID=29727 RepID=A0ABC8KY36_ERUVS|nr:unnamed protein product [Eruca vesicaria subsp. sativa]